ncbi:amidohydrolase family protein [candidate division KSB1 bacterium]|nr:amidohydrolase family protein [candidate division KSB1 bacterium]
MLILQGRIVTPDHIIDGRLRLDRGRIDSIDTRTRSMEKCTDFGQAWILPGFIDPHSHGLGSFEPLDVSGLVGMAQLETHYGVTAFLPTGAAMSVEQYIDLGRNARKAEKEVFGRGAKIAGVHLEGPFINPKSSGAMDVSTRRPIDLAEAELYIREIGPILKILTFSPELPGGLELIHLLRRHGIVPSLGHSIAAGEQLASFVKAGLRHVVHLFNAFQPSGLKEPGVFRAGLVERILVNDALTCEVICDLQHVAPEIVILAARVLGAHRFIAITDSLTGAGEPDGLYAFPNGGAYQIAGGVARLAGGSQDGALAGSMLTMNRAFYNLVYGCGIDPILAARFTSTNAAHVLKMDLETGSIEPGKRADLAVVDSSGECLATVIDGELIYRR